jgi:hypothetical protein
MRRVRAIDWLMSKKTHPDLEPERGTALETYQTGFRKGERGRGEVGERGGGVDNIPQDIQLTDLV